MHKPSKVTKPAAIFPGKLYLNIYNNRIERVIYVQDGKLMWTSYHKDVCRPYPRANFRLATSEEVEGYLGRCR
jgi:hypothetical protein